MGTPVGCMGAIRKCSFGLVPVPMVVLPTSRVLVSKRPMANMMDDRPMVEIVPFVLCTSPANPAVIAAMGIPMPCTPLPPAPWVPSNPTVLVGKLPVQGLPSVTLCAYAGVIDTDGSGAVSNFGLNKNPFFVYIVHDPELTERQGWPAYGGIFSLTTRLAKYLARLGLGSRRGMEEKIFRGEVSVNDVLVTTPTFFVSAQDKIAVSGQPVQDTLPLPRLFLYHKPPGLIVTHKDPQARSTVFGALPPQLPRLISVGRLDLNSEGLLLLTNDGFLARTLERPQTGLKRTYRVRVWGRVSHQGLAALKNGITVDGITYGPIEATLDAQKGANAWLLVSLWEGKNREIRRVLAHLGLAVNTLIRISYGPFHLAFLKKGEVEELPFSSFSSFLPKDHANERL